jgi:hypothetical protein
MTTKELDEMYSTLNLISLDLADHQRKIQVIKNQIAAEIMKRKEK